MLQGNKAQRAEATHQGCLESRRHSFSLNQVGSSLPLCSLTQERSVFCSRLLQDPKWHES